MLSNMFTQRPLSGLRTTYPERRVAGELVFNKTVDVARAYEELHSMGWIRQHGRLHRAAIQQRREMVRVRY